VKRSKHSLSNYKLCTAEMGTLFPVGLAEVLPGDTFQQSSSALVRVSPMVAPVMHPVQIRLHHFFVPNRLVWDGWEDFITGNDVETAPPTITVPEDGQNNLLDYMGVPPTEAEGCEISALPVFAFNKIYNEFYRDQDLAPERAPGDLTLPNVAWAKDYFTAARPWPQKGEDVTIPIGTTAPVSGSIDVEGTGSPSFNVDGTPNQLRRNAGGTDTHWSTADTSGGIASWANANLTATHDLTADLSLASGANVNDVRKAFALQRYQEARARYGSRYTEYLRYLGVNPSDARLQRPEYFGGGTQSLAFSEVLQTVDDETGQERGPLGRMGGHGISAMRTGRYRRFFEEHGYVITLMSVRPKSIYTQNLHRSWLRTTKEDYYQKELELIGQQEVYNNEVYADAVNGMDVFGYSDRYRDYRELPSTVSSEFRDVLDYWHMAREFTEPPVLNQSFTDCVPTKRIYAEQTQHPLWIMVNHKIAARRLVRKNASARII
jgi:hypothetical protein